MRIFVETKQAGYVVVALCLTSAGFARAATLPTTPSATLEAWFNADTLIGANGSSVNTWGNSAIAGTVGNASAGATAPTLQTAAVAFNGNNAVSFDGASALSGTVSGLTFTGGDFFIVGNLHSTSVSNGGIFAMAVTAGNDYQTGGLLAWNSGFLAGGAPSGADSYFSGNGGTTTNLVGPLNQVQIYNFDAVPGANQSVFSTTSSGTSTLGTAALPSGANASPNVFAIGTRVIGGSPSNNFATVDIAEILAYNQPLSTSDYAAVQSYLVTKYFAAVPEPATGALFMMGIAGLLLMARRNKQV
jgi:hypothetical protein